MEYIGIREYLIVDTGDAERLPYMWEFQLAPGATAYHGQEMAYPCFSTDCRYRNTICPTGPCPYCSGIRIQDTGMTMKAISNKKGNSTES